MGGRCGEVVDAEHASAPGRQLDLADRGRRDLETSLERCRDAELVPEHGPHEIGVAHRDHARILTMSGGERKGCVHLASQDGGIALALRHARDAARGVSRDPCRILATQRGKIAPGPRAVVHLDEPRRVLYGEPVRARAPREHSPDSAAVRPRRRGGRSGISGGSGVSRRNDAAERAVAGRRPDAEVRMSPPVIPHLPGHHDATALVRRLLAGRTPDARAADRVQVVPLPSPTCYLDFVQVTGPHAPVLDFTAWLLSADGEPPDGVHTPTELVAALENDEGDLLSVVVARAEFGGAS